MRSCWLAVRVHVESWCPEIGGLMLPPLPWSGKLSQGSWLLRGTCPPFHPHLFQLFEIVCVKVKVQFSNKLC